MTAGNKTYKSINKKKDDKIVLSSKNKLNNVEVLISKDLINTYIGQDEFISVNNMLKVYEKMKEVIKNPNTFNSNNRYA